MKKGANNKGEQRPSRTTYMGRKGRQRQGNIWAPRTTLRGAVGARVAAAAQRLQESGQEMVKSAVRGAQKLAAGVAQACGRGKSDKNTSSNSAAAASSSSAALASVEPMREERVMEPLELVTNRAVRGGGVEGITMGLASLLSCDSASPTCSEDIEHEHIGGSVDRNDGERVAVRRRVERASCEHEQMQRHAFTAAHALTTAGAEETIGAALIGAALKAATATTPPAVASTDTPVVPAAATVPDASSGAHQPLCMPAFFAPTGRCCTCGGDRTVDAVCTSAVRTVGAVDIGGNIGIAGGAGGSAQAPSPVPAPAPATATAPAPTPAAPPERVREKRSFLEASESVQSKMVSHLIGPISQSIERLTLEYNSRLDYNDWGPEILHFIAVRWAQMRDNTRGGLKAVRAFYKAGGLSEETLSRSLAQSKMVQELLRSYRRLEGKARKLGKFRLLTILAVQFKYNQVNEWIFTEPGERVGEAVYKRARRHAFVFGPGADSPERRAVRRALVDNDETRRSLRFAAGIMEEHLTPLAHGTSSSELSNGEKLVSPKVTMAIPAEQILNKYVEAAKEYNQLRPDHPVVLLTRKHQEIMLEALTDGATSVNQIACDPVFVKCCLENEERMEHFVERVAAERPLLQKSLKAEVSWVHKFLRGDFANHVRKDSPCVAHSKAYAFDGDGDGEDLDGGGGATAPAAAEGGEVDGGSEDGDEDDEDGGGGGGDDNNNAAIPSCCAECARVQALVHLLEDATETAELNPAEDSQEELLRYLHKHLLRDMSIYIAHVVRKVHEADLVCKILQNLDSETQFLVRIDYAQKFLAMASRESQTAYFGKRGFTYLGVMCTRLRRDSDPTGTGDTISQFFDMVTDESKEDGYLSAQLLCRALYQYHLLHTELKECVVVTDGAGHFNNAEFAAALAYFEDVSGVRVVQHVITEAGCGKSALDGHFGYTKKKVRRFVSECRDGSADIDCAADLARSLAFANGFRNTISTEVRMPPRPTSATSSTKLFTTKGMSDYSQRDYVYDNEGRCLSLHFFTIPLYRNAPDEIAVCPARASVAHLLPTVAQLEQCRLDTAQYEEYNAFAAAVTSVGSQRDPNFTMTYRDVERREQEAEARSQQAEDLLHKRLELEALERAKARQHSRGLCCAVEGCNFVAITPGGLTKHHKCGKHCWQNRRAPFNFEADELRTDCDLVKIVAADAMKNVNFVATRASMMRSDRPEELLTTAAFATKHTNVAEACYLGRYRVFTRGFGLIWGSTPVRLTIDSLKFVIFLFERKDKRKCSKAIPAKAAKAMRLFGTKDGEGIFDDTTAEKEYFAAKPGNVHTFRLHQLLGPEQFKALFSRSLTQLQTQLKNLELKKAAGEDPLMNVICKANRKKLVLYAAEALDFYKAQVPLEQRTIPQVALLAEALPTDLRKLRKHTVALVEAFGRCPEILDIFAVSEHVEGDGDLLIDDDDDDDQDLMVV